jgi:hypothetical protein
VVINFPILFVYLCPQLFNAPFSSLKNQPIAPNTISNLAGIKVPKIEISAGGRDCFEDKILILYDHVVLSQSGISDKLKFAWMCGKLHNHDTSTILGF